MSKKRPGRPASRHEKLTLEELNRLITHAEWRFKSLGKASLRKSAWKRLTSLENQREELYGVAAPARRSR